MRWERGIAWGLAAVCVAAAGMNLSCGGPAKTASAPAAPTAEQKIARGRYLTLAVGCGDCHTPGSFWGGPDETRALAGSEMGWAGPWGVVYAANLTPDSTGLLAWSEAEIATAIRTGNRPDGRQLAPAMPWMTLANLTEEDALAIAAYLKSVPAVRHAVPKPVPPGQKVTGSVLTFPPPSEWDARNLPAGGAAH